MGWLRSYFSSYYHALVLAVDVAPVDNHFTALAGQDERLGAMVKLNTIPTTVKMLVATMDKIRVISEADRRTWKCSRPQIPTVEERTSINHLQDLRQPRNKHRH